jgi:DNA-binding HxlR family transcriptional regulator
MVLKLNGEPGGDRREGSGQPGPSPSSLNGLSAGEVSWERVAEILAAVNGLWAVPVLRHLAAGVSRPADLLSAINAESKNKLSQKVMHEVLRRLISYGLISRRQVPAWPRETHYWLTGAGHEILNEVSKLGIPSSRRSQYVRDEDPPAPPGVDISIPNPARIWNYTIGGKDNFAVDRKASIAVMKAMPTIALTARLTRQFQADAVRRLTAAGVRQFIDIGTGLPVAGAVHEVAQSIEPKSRVVYVDNDPMVAAHASALLTSSPEGACDFIAADLREPGKILAHAAQTLDLDQPTGIFLIMVLHFIPDDADPWQIVARLMRGVRGPAYLVIGHAGADIDAQSSRAASEEYNARSPVPVRLRSHEEVARFFEDADTTMMDPGLVSLGELWPDQAVQDGLPATVNGHVGIGWRPALH